jgi:hypothetical protein
VAEKAKAKGGRRTETEQRSPSATTGAKAMAIAATLPRAISPTIALKGWEKKMERPFHDIVYKGGQAREKGNHVNGRGSSDRKR